MLQKTFMTARRVEWNTPQNTLSVQYEIILAQLNQMNFSNNLHDRY